MNITFDFTGRVVVVTGASQGIGRAIAARFLESGAHVAVFDLELEALDRSWAGAGDRLHTFAVDVSDPVAVDAAIHSVVEWAGGLHVVVNNAGITRDGMVWKMSDASWNAVLGVHLGGTFNLTRAAVPYLRAAQFGRIVNVTSYTGLHGNVGQANYAAAKAGIIGFTKTVAKELARFAITVNAISPNAATSMVAGVPPDKLAALTEAIPLGRFADPAEIAQTVAFLASDEAGYITGSVVPVDGGMSM